MDQFGWPNTMGVGESTFLMAIIYSFRVFCPLCVISDWNSTNRSNTGAHGTEV